MVFTFHTRALRCKYKALGISPFECGLKAITRKLSNTEFQFLLKALVFTYMPSAFFRFIAGRQFKNYSLG